MIEREQKRFDALYDKHLAALKLQGMSASTIDVYSRAIRPVTEYFDGVPDQLSQDQLVAYFGDLIDNYSWSLVKIDRNGLQFFWKHVLKQEWTWVEMIKPPQLPEVPEPRGHPVAGTPARKAVAGRLLSGDLHLATATAGVDLCPPACGLQWPVRDRHRDGEVTFRCTDSTSNDVRTLTLTGAEFVWRVIQHVLPRGFHRVRDYGFLRHNARHIRQLEQLILQVNWAARPKPQRPRFSCLARGQRMVVLLVKPPPRFGPTTPVAGSVHGPPLPA